MISFIYKLAIAWYGMVWYAMVWYGVIITEQSGRSEQEEYSGALCDE